MKLKGIVIIVGLVIIGITIIGIVYERNTNSVKTDIDSGRFVEDEIDKVPQQPKNLRKAIKKQILRIDSASLNKYEVFLDSAETSTQKDFAQKLIDIVDRFKNRTVDTTILLISNIDGVRDLDTIQSKVYARNDSVIISSIWKRRDKVLWRNKIVNPYLWIDEDSAFQYDSRGIFVTLTVALHFSLPEIDSSTFNNSIMANSERMGELRKLENDISESTFTKYITNFSGNILIYGEPEPHRNLAIWYEPKKRFLPFYFP